MTEYPRTTTWREGDYDGGLDHIFITVSMATWHILVTHDLLESTVALEKNWEGGVGHTGYLTHSQIEFGGSAPLPLPSLLAAPSCRTCRWSLPEIMIFDLSIPILELWSLSHLEMVHDVADALDSLLGRVISNGHEGHGRRLGGTVAHLEGTVYGRPVYRF